MIFNQLEFLFLFLPGVIVGFLALPHWRTEFLTAASFFFYALSGVEHAGVLLFGSVWTWAFARGPHFVGDRLRLITAIAPPVLALLYYKYLHFILQSVGLDPGPQAGSFELFENIILPAGISFFTFHLLAYALDRYWGRIETPPRLKDFLLFMSFFPHLVAGPILRYANVAGALQGLTSFRPSGDILARATGHVVMGLALKVLIADTLGRYIATLTAELDGLGAAAGLFVMLGYSFQIFFDFYGYSLVAIGLGTLFGFTFPINFDRPYLSTDIRDFWRRWHMTLSFWIRDYLYLPLGGNKDYVRNIVIVFALCGLWHGAGWNFVAWGIAHGVLVALYHRYQSSWDVLPRMLRIAATFSIVSLLWILFLFDFDEAQRFLAATAGNGLIASQVTGEMWAVLAVAAVICFGTDVERLARYEDGSGVLLRGVFLGALAAATLLFMDRSGTFIYFRF